MNAFDRKNRPPPHPLEGLQSPFLDQEIFAGEGEEEWAPRLGALEAASPFLSAFELPGAEWEEKSPFREAESLFEAEGGITGDDDRTEVQDTKIDPYRWICSVTYEKDGKTLDGGSGLLISDRHVLTAAHVITEAGSGPSAPSLYVYPGRHYGGEPFGKFLAAKTRVPNFRMDFGLITLNRPVDPGLLWWGHPSTNTVWWSEALIPFQELRQRELAITTAGFPGAKDAYRRRMYEAPGVTVAATFGGSFRHTADTTQGQSGSPIWTERGGRRILIGIVRAFDRLPNQIGVFVHDRIVRGLVERWMAEDAPKPRPVQRRIALEIPYRWVCRLEVYDNDLRRAVGYGTGLLISDRHVLTSARVIHGFAKDRRRYSVRIAPGYEFGKEALGSATASGARVSPKFSPESTDASADYGVLTLSRPLGNVTFSSIQNAALGSWGGASHGLVTSAADWSGKEARIAAFSRASGGGGGYHRLRVSSGGIVGLKGGQILHRAGSKLDAPGAPIWVEGGGRRVLIGIASSIFSSESGVNRGCYLGQETLSHLREWLNEDFERKELEAGELFSQGELESFPASPDDAGEAWADEAYPEPELGDEFLEAGSQADDFLGAAEFAPQEQEEASGEETEAYEEEALAEPEESRELCYEEETPYEEGETGEETPLPRMKFEIQTGNRIWRNDGTTASLLERKYGPRDFLVDRKGVRLESETNGVLEFETEWFRSWTKLEEALKKAVAMTDDMNGAAASKFEKSRKAFPFTVDHLRKGSTKELRQGFWDRKPGMEGDKEKILRPEEELEVEILDADWESGIQSSESFLLEHYESFLRQHEWPFYRDGAIKHARAILAGAITGGMTATEVAKLRSLLQIIVNYIMRGQGGTESDKAGAFADVAGMPPKQAFTLMSRTNFASMYKVLLTDKEKRLFQKIVKDDAVLKEMGLDRKSPVFIKGYGTKHHEPGPTAYQWLAGIAKGVDLLSVQSGKGLSAAMGRYNVETRKGKKDRWQVKFETRNTVLGAVGIKARDWVTYAQKLFDQAGKREDDALSLLWQQGITDEGKLANFVFFARHPELGGRRIRKDERTLAREWLRIRDVLVRPLLGGVQPELEGFEEAGFGDDEYEAYAASVSGGIDPELAEEAGYADDGGEEALSPDELSLLEGDLEDEGRRDPGLEGETRAPSTEIRNLQRSLNTWRSEKGQPPVKDDGLPGPETRRAILEFQKASGIRREDGIAGPATRQRLRLILDILGQIPTTPLFAENRRSILELVGGPGFRSLPEPEQTGVLNRIRGYQRPGTLDNIRHLTNVVLEPGFERLPASSQRLMLRILAARPADADLAGNLTQLIGSTGFRNLEEATQSWVLKRIEKYAGNHTRIDNLENLITTTNNFDQLSQQSRTVMLTALANRPGDARLVDNFKRAADRADFRALDQQTQTDVLNRIVTYPRAFVHVDNLMGLVTTPGFGNLALPVTGQVLDGLPSRFGTAVLTSAIIGNLMGLLTATGFEKLRPEIRDLMLDSLAQRPDNTQLATALRTLTENPRFRHDQRDARKAVLQAVDSIP